MLLPVEAEYLRPREFCRRVFRKWVVNLIAIIDYGMGNLRSVKKGFEKQGFEAEITRDPGRAREAAGLVVPGVGAFRDAMENLQAAGLDKAILEAAAENKPLLGICLGYQLLFEESEEWGLTKGLGIFTGKVRRIPPGLRVPHMGWNQLEIKKPGTILAGIPDGAAFYFVHSYYVTSGSRDIVIAETEYGIKFASVVGRGNTFGVQFHPEKSSTLGLRILQNFGRLVEKC